MRIWLALCIRCKKGVSYVLGIDISEKMLEIAKNINFSSIIEYQCMAMEDLVFSKSTFDIIISSLAFHYVKDFEGLVRKISI